VVFSNGEWDINIGSQGAVVVDGTEYLLAKREGLYIGMGCKGVSFKSIDRKDPAKFYFNSTPAHAAYPVVKVSKTNAQQVRLGTPEKANIRTINQLVHPSVLKSCQLVMGMTELAPNSVWNTMPSHTHDRRMEVYFISICRRIPGVPSSGDPRDATHRGEERTGCYHPQLVHPFRRWNRKLHLHMGHGRGESDFHRHG
jgi:hypothetical protein